MAQIHKILTMQKYGTLDEDDVRKNIRGSLFQDAIGTTQGNDSTANTINIAEDLPVPLGDPISFHPDDEMCYEIRVPPDGLCFLHTQQVRLDPIDWLKEDRTNDGYATDGARVQLECALAREKCERLCGVFFDHLFVRHFFEIVEGKYQVEQEEYRTIARTWSVNIRVTLSSEWSEMSCEEDWDCWYQLDHCEKYPTLHVLLSLLESQNGHYTALLRDLPAGCVCEPGCVKLLRIPAKPRTTKKVSLLTVEDANEDNEGYGQTRLRGGRAGPPVTPLRPGP